MEEERRPRRARGDYVRLGAAAAVLGLLLWFALANSQKVTVDFLVADRDFRLIYVIIGSAVLGAAIALLVEFRRHHR